MDLPGNFENLKTKRTGIQHQVDAVRKKMVGNFENLKTELGNLRRKRTRIQGQVDAARSKVEEIEEEVPKWLVRAKEIENNVQKLLNRTEEDEKNASNRCCPCLRPESKKRRQLRQEAVNLLQTVAEHLKAGKFDQISHPVIKGGEAFGSRASTLRDVIRSLSDPNVSTVGIYGMDGIGKTTLAKLVANHPETKYLFNWVIFVEVNEKPDETKIQREIGEKLGLPLSQEESSSTIAGKLCHRLRQEENILIILDNVWERLHLQAIGIPRRHEHKGCKLLLTARSVDVLSSKMDSQSNFKVHDLHHDEALRFFKKMAGDYIEGHDEFKSVATELANKCACSPIAIAIVARALKNKQLLVWKDFLQQVKMSSSKVVLYASIELSYKYLTREQQKTLLLIQYASLTSIDELLMYGMSLGLFDDIEEMEGRRARVKTFVQQLKDSCLLADGNTTPDDFSMHDIVRGIVKSIASRELCAFTYEGVAEREWPDGNTLKAYSSIVLKDVKAGGLPPVLECQQLKLLSISATDPGLFLDSCSSLKIHDDFFTKMTELKVLVLANMDLSSLPKSIRFLSNLQALGLYKCKLDDVAILGELKKLEILSLRNSKIDQLSAEVCHLIQLKLLDLRSTHVRVIPPNVISNLSTLEELYMGEFAWEKDGFDKARESASLNELNDLSKLTCLEIQINDSDALPSDLSFRKLERYKILIGSLEVWEFDRDWIWNFTSPNTCRKFQLSLVNTNICLNEGHIMQLKRIEDLCLVGLQDMKSVLHGLDKDGFLQLKYLQVRDNDNLLCIVDSMEHDILDVFPILQSLLIRNLVNLEKICCGQLTTESSFSQLRKIKVERCGKLDNIFSVSIAKRLQLLESIVVIDCKNMKDIFAIEKEDESNNIETIENIKLNQLRSLTLKSLPQLKSFCSKLKIPCTSKKGGDEVMFEDDITVSCTLFTKEAALPNLDYLELREINVRTIWQNHVAAIASGIKNLTRLILHGCNNLRYLFSSSIASNFAQLQHLHISECQALEVVVATEEGGCIELPSLKQLEIRKCPKLKEFMVENTSTDNLKKVPLVGYDKKERHHPPCHPPPADFSPQSVKNGAEFNGSNYSTQKPSSEYLGYKSFIDEGLKLENMTVDESIKIHSPSFKEEELKVKNMTVDDSIKLQSPFLKEGEFKIKEMSTNKLTEVPSPSFNRKGLKLKNMTVDESTKIHSPSFKEEEFKIKEMSANKLTEVPSSSFNKKEFMGKSTSAHQVEKNSLSSFKKKEFAAKNISPDELTKITLSFFNKKVVLPNLENLIIEECNNLQCLFSSSTVKSFLGLQCLEIFRCPVLEVIFDLEGANSENKYTGIVSQLRELKIHALPKLKHVWNKDPQKLVSFEQLKRVSIIECDGLRNVFPMSIAKSLSKLRTLDISKCGVEEIVYVGGQGAKTNTTFVFPRVISLQLYDLPNFKMFCPGIYTAEWPELKELRMSGWETVMKILESNEGLAHTLLEKVLPNLKKLSVQAKDIAMIRQYPEHLIDFICKIKYLEVDLDNATAIVSLDLLLQRLDSMKMLQICGTNIDPYGEVLDENGGMSAVIKNLNKCSDLDHILKEECNMNHLVHLRVYMCLKLINLVPSFTSFRNLTTLQLSYCHRLTNIVPSSTAKSLVQLRKMSIESCDRLTEVVAADEEDAAKDCEIVCNQLKELHLFRLASLSSFCSANYTLKFPSLEELHAGKCPKMKSFSGGELSTPKLQEITYQGTTVKLRKGDLNTTIQELHEEERLLQHSKEDSAGPPSTQPPE